jgi:hypothetical protein
VGEVAFLRISGNVNLSLHDLRHGTGMEAMMLCL